MMNSRRFMSFCPQAEDHTLPHRGGTAGKVASDVAYGSHPEELRLSISNLLHPQKSGHAGSAASGRRLMRAKTQQT